MTPSDFTRMAKEAESRLAEGRRLSRQDQVLLLAAMLLRQPTRKETRYGQT